MKYFLICVGLLAALCSGRAQLVSTSQVLATARNAPAYTAYQGSLGFLRAENFKLPFLEKTEFRTANNGLELSQLEYALRVSTNGRGEIKAENDLHQARIGMAEASALSTLSKCLKERYKLAVQTVYTEALQAAKERLIELLEERQRLWFATLQSGQRVDVSGLADTETDIRKEQLELIELEARQVSQQQLFQVLMNQEGPVRLDSSNWITVEQISALMPAVSAGAMPSNPILQQQLLEQEWAEYNYQKQMAQHRNLLDFVQTEYNGNRGTRFNEVFGVRLGINLPFAGKDRLDINKALLQKKESEQEYGLLENEVSESIRQLSVELNILIRQYQYLSLRQEDALSYRILTNPALLSQLPPLELSHLKVAEQERRISLLELHHKLMLAWLSLLETSGKLVEFPLRNYLSEQLEVF